MKSFKVVLLVLLAVLFVSGMSFAATKGTSKQESKCDKEFVKADTDKDGKISLKEFLAIKKPKVKANTEVLFKEKDANTDGYLSKDEFCAKELEKVKTGTK